MSERRDTDPLEGRLGAWLADRPDAPPDRLARTAADRARSRRQRPGWLARLRQGPGGARGAIRGPAPLLAGAAVVVAIVVLGGPLLGRLSGPGEPGPTTSPTSGQPSPRPTESVPSPAEPSGPPALELDVTRTIPLDRQPTAVGFAFESLWVTNVDHDLLRIDPASGEVVARIPLGASGCGPIQSDPVALWLQTCSSGSVLGPEVASTIRVDPVANAVATRYEDGQQDGVGIGTLRGHAWFISGPTTITGAFVETGEADRTLEVEATVLHLTAGFGSLWLSPVGSPTVVRLDPDSGEVLATIDLSGDSGYLAASGDAVWTSEPHQWLLAKLGPAVNSLAGEYGAAPTADQIVFDAFGRVWVLAHEELIGIDIASGAEVARYAVPLHDTVGIESHVLATDADGIWFGAPDGLWFIPGD